MRTGKQTGVPHDAARLHRQLLCCLGNEPSLAHLACPPPPCHTAAQRCWAWSRPQPGSLARRARECSTELRAQNLQPLGFQPVAERQPSSPRAPTKAAAAACQLMRLRTPRDARPQVDRTAAMLFLPYLGGRSCWGGDRGSNSCTCPPCLANQRPVRGAPTSQLRMVAVRPTQLLPCPTAGPPLCSAWGSFATCLTYNLLANNSEARWGLSPAAPLIWCFWEGGCAGPSLNCELTARSACRGGVCAEERQEAVEQQPRLPTGPPKSCPAKLSERPSCACLRPASMCSVTRLELTQAGKRAWAAAKAAADRAEAAASEATAAAARPFLAQGGECQRADVPPEAAQSAVARAAGGGRGKED